MLKDALRGWRGTAVAAWSVVLFMWAIGYGPNQESNNSTPHCALNDVLAGISPEGVIAIFTVVLAVVGWLTYITFNRQGDIMQSTLAQMKVDASTRASEANRQFGLLKAQIRLASDQLNATHRPKIIVHSISLPMDFSPHNPDDMHIGASMLYFNIGSSPANIIDIRARILRQQLPLDQGKWIHDEMPIRTPTLEGGMKESIIVKWDQMLNFEKTIQRAKDPTHGVPICMGTIRYKDGRG